MPFDTSAHCGSVSTQRRVDRNDSKEDELADSLAESSSIAGRLYQPRKYSGVHRSPLQSHQLAHVFYCRAAVGNHPVVVFL